MNFTEIIKLADIATPKKLKETLNNISNAIKTQGLGAKETYSNALKGYASGKEIRIDGVTPLVDKVEVNVSGVDNPETVTVTRYGKNLIPFPYKDQSGITRLGVTFTVRDDGAIVCNGTCTDQGNTYFVLTPYGNELMLRLLGTESFGSLSGSSVTKNGVTLSPYIYQNGSGQVSINPPKGELVDFVVYPQIELGEIATAYEPYQTPITYTPDTNGNFEISDITPTTTLFADNDNALLSCVYNRDINAFPYATEKFVENAIVNKADKIYSPYPQGSSVSFYAYEANGTPRRQDIGNAISHMLSGSIVKYWNASIMSDTKPTCGIYVADPVSKSAATNKDYVDNATKMFKHIIRTFSSLGTDGLELNFTLEITNKIETQLLPPSNFYPSDLTTFIDVMKSIYGTANIPNITGYVVWFDFENFDENMNPLAYNAAIAEAAITYDNKLKIVAPLISGYEAKNLRVNATDAEGGGFSWEETVIEI